MGPTSASPAHLAVVRQGCIPQQGATCEDFDAIVFVHGIYGDKETFFNSETNFNWPASIPERIKERRVDVYRLDYFTELLAWGRTNSPSFSKVAEAIYDKMTPLRKRRYRSIGFIAHSLGGNIVATYLLKVKLNPGHPYRAQHAFVITLATPVAGAHIANIVGELKRMIPGMSDSLLKSLESSNLYLEMLNQFRADVMTKEVDRACRPVQLHAAYERELLGPVKVVHEASAGVPIEKIVSSPIRGFDLDHSEIAKPRGIHDEPYDWAMERVESEFVRLSAWADAHKNFPEARRLCEREDFIPGK